MHIRILTFFLFIQSLVSCQQAREFDNPLAASICTPASSGCQPGTQQTQPSAAAIIFSSEDGGQSWQDISAGLPQKLETEGVYFSGNDVVLGSGHGLYRHNTSTSQWEQVPFLNGRITGVFSSQNGLFACSYGLSLFQNIPGTEIWKNLTNTLENKAIRCVWETPDGAILIGCDNGIFKSADGGLSWKQVFDGDMVLDIVALGDALIGGGRQGVLRSTDGGEHWTNVLYENIMSKKTGTIGDRFFTIFGTQDPTKIYPEGITNRLRISSDGGKTFQRADQAVGMDKDLSQIRDIYDLVQAGEYLFCSFDTGIYRSSDLGKSWELVFPSNNKWSFRLAVFGNKVYAVQGGGC